MSNIVYKWCQNKCEPNIATKTESGRPKDCFLIDTYGIAKKAKVQWCNVLIILALLAFTLPTWAQNFKILDFSATDDMSAYIPKRKDHNQGYCGLVKVRLASAGVQFEGNIVPPIEYKEGTYWVYMDAGAKELYIKHPNITPLTLHFSNYGMNHGIESLITYNLELEIPPSAVIKTQKLIVNYTPEKSYVLIDDIPYQSNGHLELTLPAGVHNYQIVALGYNTVEGSVKLNSTNSRIITENLPSASQRIVLESQKPETINDENTSDATDETIKTFVVNGVSFNMVSVDGGTFLMGATKEQLNPFDDEKPEHKVTLSSYHIGETEVTQALWEAVMGNNPSHFKGARKPAENISWKDCDAFINKLNELTGWTFRFPTEAEWEFAARGGSKSKGCQYSGSDNINDVAWYDTNSFSSTHDVKSKLPNELGLYDMSGNVWEWCMDWYGNYEQNKEANPKGSLFGSKRVRRGGCWCYNEGYCRVSLRIAAVPDNHGDYIGMRLAF